jgi:3-oxoadipate enol-lactonase
MKGAGTTAAPVAVHHVEHHGSDGGRARGPGGDADGGAPVLVLSSSLGTTLELWQPQIAALARHFRVVRYDLRGHGRSPAPPGPYAIADLGGDLIALLDRLRVARAHLAGLSLGGMASLWAAAHHPERVDRLIVCCASARLGPAEAWVERAATVTAHGMDAVADAVVDRWFTAAFKERQPGRVAAMRAMLAATPAAGYAACCGAIARMDLGPDLGAIRAPTLAIAGADDPATPPEHLLRIAAGVAHGRAVVVPRAAHLANVEQPRMITALMLAHLGVTAETGANEPEGDQP